jgi:hypothetical protein
MRHWDSIGKIMAACVVASMGIALWSPVFAQERRAPSTVVAYGEASRDWVAEVQRFAALLDPPDRPVALAGATAKIVPEDVALVWFGSPTISFLAIPITGAHFDS